MNQPYQKGWLSYADQVQRLQQRGLVVSDLRKAEQFLSHLNYYRFNGYCLAFESQRHTFVAGTTFEQIVDAYQFDLSLRDLVTEALGNHRSRSTRSDRLLFRSTLRRIRSYGCDKFLRGIWAHGLVASSPRRGESIE